MMPSIKQEVYKLLGSFILLLIVLFTLLMYLNVRYGISTDTRNNLAYQGALLERDFEQLDALPELVNSEILSVFTNLSSMPTYVRGGFDWSDMDEKVMHERQLLDELNKSRYVYVMKYPITGLEHPVYIVSNYDEELEEVIRYEDTILQGSVLHIVSGIVLIVLSILLFSKILYSQLLSPVQHLLNWLVSLEEDKLPSKEKLKYIELERITDEIKQGLKKQKEFIDKEAFFLRTISHELRTPIAIITSSGELLERLSIPNNAVERATGRIMYAANQMKTLVQTLLWLSRKSDTPLPICRVGLASIISKIVDNNEYLAKDREVRFNLTGLDAQASIVDNHGAIQLVLENLIRNAIQYTLDGEITIEIVDQTVVIKNPVIANIDVAEVESYGIGLYLVEKICHAKNYTFELATEHNTVVAKVLFTPLITD